MRKYYGLRVGFFNIGRFFIYMENAIVSHWTGSANTAELVRKQIIARWGADEASNYDPKSNCLTFKQWLKVGYVVKKGETALKSFVMIEEKDKDGQVISKYHKTVNLFYVRQVEKIS